MQLSEISNIGLPSKVWSYLSATDDVFPFFSVFTYTKPEWYQLPTVLGLYSVISHCTVRWTALNCRAWQALKWRRPIVQLASHSTQLASLAFYCITEFMTKLRNLHFRRCNCSLHVLGHWIVPGIPESQSEVTLLWVSMHLWCTCAYM